MKHRNKSLLAEADTVDGTTVSDIIPQEAFELRETVSPQNAIMLFYRQSKDNKSIMRNSNIKWLHSFMFGKLWLSSSANLHLSSDWILGLQHAENSSSFSWKEPTAHVRRLCFASALTVGVIWRQTFLRFNTSRNAISQVLRKISTMLSNHPPFPPGDFSHVDWLF